MLTLKKSVPNEISFLKLKEVFNVDKKDSVAYTFKLTERKKPTKMLIAFLLVLELTGMGFKRNL